MLESLQNENIEQILQGESVSKSVVIIGLGEMGGVFARGFLRSGIPVFPVTRTMNVQQAVKSMPNPDLVLLAVGESDLQASLSNLPAQWRDKTALLQNELLPKDWQGQLTNPTVISVWFEKKKGQDVKVLIPSPVYGQGSELIKAALTSIDIPVEIKASAAEMELELVLKNVYILTTNIAGLECGGNVDYLWNEQNALAREVADEVMDIQTYLTGETLDREVLIEGFVHAMKGDPEHMCMGRSAPARLTRAIAIADEANLAVPKLRSIMQKHVVK